MKGQQQALSAILITGVLIGVVGSVYFWGLPLIQKNKDISLLENSEGFMLNLNNKIKDIANHGGRDKIDITIPGIVKFDGNITLEIDTFGSIYAADVWIPLCKNNCSITTGTWGIHNPETLCLLSRCIGGDGKCEEYQTEYKLQYIDLSSGTKSYKIELVGDKAYGGEGNFIQIENKGTTSSGNLISTKIEISIL